MPELDLVAARRTLVTGCETLALALTEQQYRRLLDYLQLLVKWNRAYNLTAVRDPQQMVVRHLLDSLAVVELIPGQRIIDVGTGAGLPGVPLAILYPQRDIHLLDSNGKKTRFLFQVKTALSLDNMTVHHRRVESFRPEQPFDVVTSRAFASIPEMISGCSHLLHSTGRFYAMKGQRPDKELAASEGLCQLLQVIDVVVPGLNEKRHLVAMALPDAVS